MKSFIDKAEDIASIGTMTMRVYHRIRQDIIMGILPPGQKLKIEELTNTYEFGTSPIREALNLLTSFGFVDRLENRGFQVRGISAEEFDDLLQVRCWVEERALREAIARGEPQWEEEIALARFRIDRATRDRQDDISASPDWEVHHKAFHMTLVAGCGSPLLTEYCERLYDQNIRYRQISGLASIRLRDGQSEHDDIAKAVLERNADVAVGLLLRHYKRTGEYLRMKLFQEAS
jgi:DNA-binding GntR family transcriptional regulator